MCDTGKPRNTLRVAHSFGGALLPALTGVLLIGLTAAPSGGSVDQRHLLVAATPAPPQPASPVPMFRANPAHTGEQPGPGPTGTPTLLWRFGTSAGIASSPSYADGILYVGSEEGFVYAVDAVSGLARWGVFVGDRVRTTPTLAGGVVTVTNGDIHAMEPASGELLLSVQSDRYRVSISPTVGGDILFAGGIRGTRGFADARDPETGVIYWRRDLPSAVASSPAVTADTVYVGTLGADLYALSAETGDIRWRFQSAGAIYAAPAIADGTVFVTSWNDGPAPAQGLRGKLYALDAATGEERWQLSIETPVESSPALSGGMVFVGAGTQLYAVDALSGIERWRFTARHQILSSPSVADGVIYVASRDGNLYALTAAEGIERWRFPLGAASDASPVVVGGVIYMTSGSNLLAIGGSGMPALAGPTSAIATPPSP